jgi:hypothetical protein
VDAERADCLRVTGLMVKKIYTDPKEHVKSLFEKNKRIYNERQQVGGKGIWYRNDSIDCM